MKRRYPNHVAQTPPSADLWFNTRVPQTPNLCGLSRGVLWAMLSQDELDILERFGWQEQIDQLNRPRKRKAVAA